MGVWWLSNQSLPSSYPTTKDCFDEFFSACLRVARMYAFCKLDRNWQFLAERTYFMRAGKFAEVIVNPWKNSIIHFQWPSPEAEINILTFNPLTYITLFLYGIYHDLAPRLYLDLKYMHPRSEIPRKFECNFIFILEAGLSGLSRHSTRESESSRWTFMRV